jgi:hypothetical protein
MWFFFPGWIVHKNVERGIYEYVDREKVLYFLH